MRFTTTRTCAFLALLGLLAGPGLAAGAKGERTTDEFHSPTRIIIEGYEGADDHAMEPFITRGGNVLFFNNRNNSEDNTDLHFATRKPDGKFLYRGRVQGVNTDALDAVATMDDSNRFYFISSRTGVPTIYAGLFMGGTVSGVAPIEGDVHDVAPGGFVLGPEISAEGDTLYFVEAQTDPAAGTSTMNIAVAHRQNGAFFTDTDDNGIFKHVNTDVLEYAPAISADGLELYFNRLTMVDGSMGVGTDVGIYVAKRSKVSLSFGKPRPFGKPRRISAIEGFVEGATITGDGLTLYFHKWDAGFQRFVIYKVERTP